VSKNHEEDDLQIACTQRLNYLQKTVDFYWFHVPNGGKRDAITGARLKMMGVKPGVADIIILGPNAFCGYIELKSKTGRQSKSQEEFQEIVEGFGFTYELARDHEAVIAIVKNWLQS